MIYRDLILRAYVSLDIPIPAKAGEIQLIVTDGGDGNVFDHADWCEASFITGATTVFKNP